MSMQDSKQLTWYAAHVIMDVQYKDVAGQDAVTEALQGFFRPGSKRYFSLAFKSRPKRKR